METHAQPRSTVRPKRGSRRCAGKTTTQPRVGVVIALAAHAIAILAEGSTPAALVATAVSLLCPLTALKDGHAFRLALLLALMTAWRVSGAPMVWPVYLLGPLALSLCVAHLVSPRIDLGAYIRLGRLNAAALCLVAATIALSSAALAGWLHLVQPDLAAKTVMIPDVAPLTLALAALVFATVNAALEEILWRGVVWRALLDRGLSRWAIVAVQALSFGAFHLHGFPSGAAGVVLATAFGALMGVLRLVGRGLAAPLIAHFVTDLIIFAFVAGAVYRWTA